MAWLLEEEKMKVKVPFHKLNAETTAPIWQCDVKDWCQVFFFYTWVMVAQQKLLKLVKFSLWLF